MWPGIIEAGVTALGGLLTNKMTGDRADKAMEFSAEQAAKQMDFQERMSSTAYQRAMKDMRAAGLNPILAYQKGGASAPSGSAGSSTFSPAMDVLGPAVSTAMQGRRLSAEVQNMEETNKNLRAQNSNLHAENVRIGATTANINADTKIKTEMFQKALSEASRAKTDEAFFETPIGKVIRIIGQTGKELNPFLPNVSVHQRPQ